MYTCDHSASRILRSERFTVHPIEERRTGEGAQPKCSAEGGGATEVKGGATEVQGVTVLRAENVKFTN